MIENASLHNENLTCFVNKSLIAPTVFFHLEESKSYSEKGAGYVDMTSVIWHGQ